MTMTIFHSNEITALIKYIMHVSQVYVMVVKEIFTKLNTLQQFQLKT